MKLYLYCYFQKEAGDKEFTSIVRLSPSLPTIAQALAEIFLRFRWKSVVVIGVGEYEQ